jgi:catechol 2,3-dioxygenase-like lactoylglutathione lyase family enzyme
MASLPTIPAPKTAQVQRFLHVNHNCADLDASAELYIALFGMRVVMRTGSTDGDGKAMGIDGLVDSRVSFLYDHRGARRSPSLELVTWDKPAMAPKLYTKPNHIGMQSVAYSVPSLAGFNVELGATGRPVGSFSNGSSTAVLFKDLDGLTVEVHEDASLEKAQSRHVRLCVGDLARSTAWYEAIGYEVTRSPGDESWRWEVPAGKTYDAKVRTTAMMLPTDASYTLELVQWLDPKSEGVANPDANDQGLYRMALGVADSRVAAAALKDAGWPHVNPPASFILEGTPLPELWIAFARDADGITVELVERPL